MARESKVSESLRKLLVKVTALTVAGTLHWEKQVGSAHRYARWNNNLLILGPDHPLSEPGSARYLFITPFDSPACVEINSNDAELGQGVLGLVAAVEASGKGVAPTDPFAISEEFLDNLTD